MNCPLSVVDTKSGAEDDDDTTDEAIGGWGDEVVAGGVPDSLLRLL